MTPREALEAEIAKFAIKLEARLEQRCGNRSAAFRLDLRHRSLGRLGILTLRNPESADWPKRGDTTTNRSVALKWLREKYAAWLLRKVQPLMFVGAEPAVQLTVGEALDAYIAHLGRKLGKSHNTFINRRSNAEVHIKPALGHLPFTREALTKSVVRSFLEHLEVTVSRYGPVKRRRAGRATIEAVRDTLSGAWSYHHPDLTADFRGLRLELDDGRAERVEAVRAGEVGVGRKVTSYTHADIERILTAAAWYDGVAIEQCPNVLATTIPNSAAFIAIEIATGMRLAETCLWRWKHVFDEDGAIWVPGTKNTSAMRYSPLQVALRPWLTAVREQRERRGVCVRDDWFVVAARWAANAKQPAGTSTYQGRCAVILELAGLRVRQKATHIFRATHITWGIERPDLVQANELKAYIGHARAHGETTSLYVDGRPPFMPERTRSYIDLPTPEQIASNVASFQPSVSLAEARLRARREGAV